MIELWEMSDGRWWEVRHLSQNRVMVFSLLSDNQLSVVGEFENESRAITFAAAYLSLTVVWKVRED